MRSCVVCGNDVTAKETRTVCCSRHCAVKHGWTKGRSVPLENRFWIKVDKRGPDECWNWQGSFFRNGYGQFNAKDRKDGQFTAEQQSYELSPE